MATKHTGTELTVWQNPQSFAITVTAPAVELNPELAAEIAADDQGGFEKPRTSLPIVSIRQKEVKNERGKIEIEAGGFRIYDAVSKAAEQSIPDVPGEVGLVITPILDLTSRIYWMNVSDDKPSCRSIDGKTGLGNPGGHCAVCPMSQWGKEGERPACNQQMNILVWDHALSTCYTLRLGRSGLGPWDTFKAMVSRMGVGPLHTFKILVSTAYKADPKPHFVPVFMLGAQIEVELFRKLKKIRTDYADLFQTTTEIRDEEPNGQSNDVPMADPGGDLPPDVEPVDTDKLPFL